MQALGRHPTAWVRLIIFVYGTMTLLKASLELRHADGGRSERRNGENGEFRASVPPEVRRQRLRNASERERIITDTS